MNMSNSEARKRHASPDGCDDCLELVVEQRDTARLALAAAEAERDELRERVRELADHYDGLANDMRLDIRRERRNFAYDLRQLANTDTETNPKENQ